MKCDKCGNTERLPDGNCAYCVWRGDAGPGLTLKKVIGKTNRQKDTKPPKRGSL